jgi:osmoprotectant transport system ATP-binding protein
VTHDIDEAIKMGDRIAIMKDGRLVQYDTPEAILAKPMDAFVDEFVGSDRALKRLALIPAAEVMTAGLGAGDARPRIAVDASARDALSAMLAAGADSVTLIDENGAPRGTITLAAMRTRLSARDDSSSGEPRPLPIH